MTLDDERSTNRMYVEAQAERDQAAAWAEWQEQRELESSETMEALWSRTMAQPKPAYLCGESVDRPGLDRRCFAVDGDPDRREIA